MISVKRLSKKGPDVYGRRIKFTEKLVGKICQPVLFLFRGKDNIPAFLHRGVQSLNEKVCKVIILRQAFKKYRSDIRAQQKIDDNIIF